MQQTPGPLCICTYEGILYLLVINFTYTRIQQYNTLGDEIDLGARATVIRKRKDGTVITDMHELIKCSKYGNANRNSDPVVCVWLSTIILPLSRSVTT